MTAHEQRSKKRKVQKLKEDIAEGFLRLLAWRYGVDTAEEHARRHANRHAAILLDVLAAKFGPVPADVQKRVEQASLVEIVGWGGHVRSAATVEDALAPVELPPPLPRPPLLILALLGALGARRPRRRSRSVQVESGDSAVARGSRRGAPSRSERGPRSRRRGPVRDRS